METAENPNDGGGVVAAPDMFIHPVAAGQVDKEMLDKLRAGKA